MDEHFAALCSSRSTPGPRTQSSSMESPNLEFEYGDTDSLAAELSELYSYTEEPEFALNRDYFEEDFKSHGRECVYRVYVMRLLDALEVTDRDKRLKVSRAILYLAQGVYDECDTDVDVLRWARHNVFLLYHMGVFSALLELLNMEIDNSQACSSAARKPAISLADSTELRVLLSIMYLMVENIRVQTDDDRPDVSHVQRGALRPPPLLHGDQFTLGGFEELQAMKVRSRERLQLPPLAEDSLRVPLLKQDSLDTYNERDPFKSGEESRGDGGGGGGRGGPGGQGGPVDEDDDPDDPDGGLEGDVDPLDRDVIIQAPPPPPPLRPSTADRLNFPKGLPWAPKVRDIDTLHKYVSIAEVQIKREQELQKCPMTLGEEEVEETPAELLYLGMLPNLSQYVIALLKLLLAAAPTSKAKTDSINILADVLPEEMPITFEIVSQHLVFANCIPLILKFFNQNIMSYISAKNSICVLDFPHSVVHELPELTAESLMLVVFKSAPILKRALKVKQAMMQLYVLKLLKIQTKYLGRQWRKSNMKTMSAIYQKVRHRLNDDWAYGNGEERMPVEECDMRENIEKFNSRRYDRSRNSGGGGGGGGNEFAPVDNCLQSVLGQRVELPEDFQYSYELWLEREVFSQPIQWEGLLERP
ncbi:hypothetical protein CRUP_034249 [Coryphaenoides rupestris]|nr:hypothetical protein CRUP_034249 [Coryphaenoides rupestris]